MIVQLLEREACLVSLAGYADEARHGEGRLVLVAGEAGVGKSALVEQLHNDLPDARWSWGACDGLFTPAPLGPLLDLAGQLGGEPLGFAQRTRFQQYRKRLVRPSPSVSSMCSAVHPIMRESPCLAPGSTT